MIISLVNMGPTLTEGEIDMNSVITHKHVVKVH